MEKDKKEYSGQSKNIFAEAHAHTEPGKSFFGRFVEDFFGFDKRSVALFRFFLGMTIVGDLIDRGTDLEAHYSDSGALPRSSVLNSFSSLNWLSFHMINGTWRFAAIVFLLHGFIGLCIAFGYRTKLMSILNLFFVNSLLARNLLVLHGGDIYLRLVVFWSCWLPMGDRWSIDYWTKENERVIAGTTSRYAKRKNYIYCHMANMALMLQAAAMYSSSAYHKTSPVWTKDRTATFYALSLDYFRTDLGDLIMKFPNLMKFFTAAVLEWERYGAIFFFIPIFTQWFRLFGCVGFLALHLGFGTALRLGTFYWICSTALLAPIPPVFWDLMVNKLLRTKAKSKLKIYYNPHSTFFSSLIIFFKFILHTDTNYVGLKKGESGEHARLGSESSLAVSDHKDRAYSGMEAIGIVLSHSVFPPFMFFAPLFTKIEFLKELGNLFLDWQTKRDLARPTKVDKDSPQRTRAIANRKRVQKLWKLSLEIFLQVWLMVLICCFTTWVMGNVGGPYRCPSAMKGLVVSLRLDQSWGMFSPRPPDSDWWYVFESEADDGRKFELFNNEGIFNWQGNWHFSYNRSMPFYKSYKNHRWFKFFEAMNYNQNGNEIRLQFGRWICREWNKRHHGPDMLYRYKIWYMSEFHNADGSVTPRPNHLLWEHICYDKRY